MPRIGTRPEEQSTGGSGFSFAEGNGRIVDARVANHAIPGFGTKCGYIVAIQRLDKNWQPTQDEPVEEFLAAGDTDKLDSTGAVTGGFHPGLAASSEDSNPDLEWGGRLDAGSADGAEGTCLLMPEGSKGPDKKSKLVIFSNSCMEAGVKHALFNGYAPNLIGLEASFTQKMLEKGANYSGKRDPTCLIVGRGGLEAGREVHKYPDAQTAAAPKTGAAPKPAAKTAPAPAIPKAGPVPVAVTAEQAAAAEEQAPPVNGSAQSGSPADGGWAQELAAAKQAKDAGQIGALLMQAMQQANPGQALTTPRAQARLQTLLSKHFVPSPIQKQVLKLAESADWMQQMAEYLDFVYDPASGTVTFAAQVAG